MIKENVPSIRKRIALVCSKFNRDFNSITVVAVSKGRASEQIKEAFEAGITDIGENRVQEALLKYNELQTPNSPLPGRQAGKLQTIRWHMVGHLQTNKIKEAVRIFDLIHSVDSIRLAKEIDKESAKINKIQNLLIEIKTSPEAAKFGLKPDEAVEFMKEIAELKNISIKGLMTIAPIVDNPEKTRPYFMILKELLFKINRLGILNYELKTLSMGMTDDFEVAIEEGSNMLRLGRAIFSR
jgi:pyridoxal phosphate enzyme (YggS family)